MTHFNSVDSSKLFTSQKSFNTYLDESIKTINSETKGRYLFVNKGQTIELVGRSKKIVEIFRGIFGFVNRTSKEVLEFQVLKVITCGAQNKWIDETNYEKINELSRLMFKISPNIKKHCVLESLTKTINDVRYEPELNLNIDFKQFNKVYFESHKSKLSQYFPCVSLFFKVLNFFCYPSYLKVKESNLKLEQTKVGALRLDIDSKYKLFKAERELQQAQDRAEREKADAARETQRVRQNQLAKEQTEKENKEREKIVKEGIEKQKKDQESSDNEVKHVLEEIEQNNQKENKIPQQQAINDKPEIPPKVEILPKNEAKEPINKAEPAVQKNRKGSIQDKNTGFEFPRYVEIAHDDAIYELKATGVATRTYAGFKVYSISSYLEESVKIPEAEANKFEPFEKDEHAKQLIIKWYRSVDAKTIQTNCIKALPSKQDFLKRYKHENYDQLEKDFRKCVGFFNKDTKKADEHTFQWFPDGTVKVLVNEENVGHIKNAVFAKFLWKNWFGLGSHIKRDLLVSTEEFNK